MSLLTTLILAGKQVLYLAMPVIAMIALPTFASAANSYRGTMNLPVEVRWNKAVLEPGRYTISVETDPNGGQFIYVHGDSTNLVILAGPPDSANVTLKSRVTLVKVGNAYVVKRLEAGVMGQSFKFQTPKGLSDEPIRAISATETFIEVAGTR